MNLKAKLAIGVSIVGSLAFFASCGDNPDFVKALEDDGALDLGDSSTTSDDPASLEGGDAEEGSSDPDESADTQDGTSSTTDVNPNSSNAEGLAISSNSILSSSGTEAGSSSTQAESTYEDVKILNVGDRTLYITEDNQVKDKNGNVVGQYVEDKKAIVDMQGVTLVNDVDKNALEDGKLEVVSSSSSEVTSSSEGVSSGEEPTTSSGTISVTYEGELEQTLMKGAKFSPVVFKNVEKDPGQTGGRPNTMYYLEGKYDANAKTYTLSGTVPTYDLQEGQNTETITIGDQKFVIKINVSTTQTTPVTYTGGALEQDVMKGGSITPIVFSNVQVNPEQNNGRSNTAYYLTFKYDADKMTYTVSGTVPDGYDLQDAAKTETLTLGGKQFVIKINVVDKLQPSSSSVAPSSSSVKPSSSSVVPSSSSVKPSSSSVVPSSSSVKPSSSSVAPSSSSVKPSSSSVAPSSSSVKPSSSSVAPSSSSVKPSSSSVVPSSSSVKPSSSSVAPSSSSVKPSSSSVVPSSSSVKPSSSSQPEDMCYDKASGEYVKLYANLSGPNGEQYAYQANCAFTCYYDPTGNDCIAAQNGGSGQQSSSSVKPSSSSVVPSSSSVKPSSSSVAPSSSSVKPSSSSVAPSSSSVKPSSSSVVPSSSSVKPSSSSVAPSSSSVKSSSSIGVTYEGNLKQTVAQGGSITPIVFKNVDSDPGQNNGRTYTIYYLDFTFDSDKHTYTVSGSTPSDYIPNNDQQTETLTFGSQKFTIELNIIGAAPSSSSVAQQSSSSVKPSSSSVVPSSSSMKSSSSQQQSSGGSLLPKIINSNVRHGYATRYWDSCKPHCAWSGNSNPPARTCLANGITRADAGAKSICDDGGVAGTCFDQTPQIVNDTIAYAFAASPGGGNDCGKCYMLTFTGEGASATSTPTNDHHRAIKGKHLIIMSSNIGYDVANNQFDLMIPGGGPGIYNACDKMGISCAGEQYGGFLASCGYNDKNCLIRMCNEEYTNESLRNGCLFLANWMDAANNPEIDFVEVECPQALKDKY